MRYAFMLLLAGAALSLGIADAQAHQPDHAQAEGKSAPAMQEAKIGGPFTLFDQQGRKTSDTDFRGKYMLVFFGYTNCPDECPLAAGNMSAAMQLLDKQPSKASGMKADKVVPLFISVDPKRDTPKALARFLKPLDKRFVGLTGSKAQLDAVADEYKVYSHMHDDGGAVDHSAYIYLMGPDGKYITHFANDASPQLLAEGIAKQVQ
jgi:protein SCO1/2